MDDMDDTNDLEDTPDAVGVSQEVVDITVLSDALTRIKLYCASKSDDPHRKELFKALKASVKIYTNLYEVTSEGAELRSIQMVKPHVKKD